MSTSNNFRTEIFPPEAKRKVLISDELMLLGSCFSENIGERLLEQKFRVDTNPFGILFNPKCLQHSLDRMLDGKLYKDGDLFYNDVLESYCSWDHHSSFSKNNQDKDESLSGINSRLLAGHQNLKRTKWLFLTFGTAWVYELKSEKSMSGKAQVVANCHKMPQQWFDKRLLGIQEITNGMSQAFERLFTMNPDIQVVLTVSPVRHWRDGPVANGRSKSHLARKAAAAAWPPGGQGRGSGAGRGGRGRLAFFHHVESRNAKMKDYRFYAEDMFHPSDQAIEYIWGKFQQTYFSEDTLRLIEKIDKVQQAMKHRPFRPETEAHQIFLRKQLDTISILEKEHPSLNFTIERRHFDSFLTEKGSA
ncbi:unnamed protein product [Heterosigma akashiwo]